MNLKQFNYILSEYGDEGEIYDVWFDWDLFYDL